MYTSYSGASRPETDDGIRIWHPAVLGRPARRVYVDRWGHTFCRVLEVTGDGVVSRVSAIARPDELFTLAAWASRGESLPC